MKEQFIPRLDYGSPKLPRNFALIGCRSLRIFGIGVFLSVTSCATRSTPPAQVINASQVPSYAQNTAAPAVATPPPAAPAPAKLEAIADDEPIQQVPAGGTTTPPPAATATPPAQATAGPVTPVPQVSASKTESSGNAPVLDGGWKMPTEGTLGAYSASSKGVDIMGTEGQAINAVADGKVLYSGNGLKGYGNLIIIRHDNSYLSAYAYNKANLVKEGATVTQGQKIATMGHKDANQAMLHLEVRKNGKPIDPHTMIGN